MVAMPTFHIPVMVEEVIDGLDVRPGGRYVDCTVGAGGHARAILEASAPGGQLLGIDRDPEAIRVAALRLRPFEGSFALVRGNFSEVGAICRQRGFAPVHGLLFDLGISSMQIESAERGFSFQHDAPLDMRMDPSDPLTAADIVNGWSEADLARILWRYGEEPAARRIAAAVVRARPLMTTSQLSRVIEQVAGRGSTRLHPATRAFQALRIAVNRELDVLEAALSQACDLLGSGGRLVVISFHSLEDRIAKSFLRRESADCVCPPGLPECRCGHHSLLRLVGRRARRPSDQEVAANPRARSARLRVAERLLTKEG